MASIPREFWRLRYSGRKRNFWPFSNVRAHCVASASIDVGRFFDKIEALLFPIPVAETNLLADLKSIAYSELR